MSNLIERLTHFAKGGSGPINDACAQAIDAINTMEQVNDDLRQRVALGEAENDRLERALQALAAAYREASGLDHPTTS